MTAEESEIELVQRAAAGETAALERLLVAHYDRLAAEVARKLPDEFRSVITAEDVLQETFAVAFREIHNFVPAGRTSFHPWLAAIAQHRLFDLVKGQRAAKRGGGRVAVQGGVRATEGSLLGLLDMLNVDTLTPSRAVARQEAVQAVQVGLASLKEDYRQALWLRYIEGLPVADIAARLGRTERAVHMLCHRGLRELRVALGRSSQFFSRG
jgi:RNA polymerase sigma-70 factor (ECF subfamily)